MQRTTLCAPASLTPDALKTSVHAHDVLNLQVVLFIQNYYFLYVTPRRDGLRCTLHVCCIVPNVL